MSQPLESMDRYWHNKLENVLSKGYSHPKMPKNSILRAVTT
jgi:hypothetical protein